MSFMVEWEASEISMTMLMLSASICSILAEKEPMKAKAIKILEDHTQWADHGYLNALQYMVSTLEALVIAATPSVWVRSIGDSELRLIRSALTAYQMFKTNLIQKEKEIHGSNWGDATEFSRKNWTAHLDAFEKAARTVPERKKP